MGRTSECELVERFTERYRVTATDVTRQIERAVIGGDWGANGYTTLAQADRLRAELELTRASTLLDLGAGRGWPGLYLASVTGCQVVLADVPMEALQSAKTRAAEEALAGRAVTVRCSARSLPFPSSSFDAIVHTDVLCCVRPKMAVLKSCARLLRPGGGMVFLTIHPADGLSPSQRRRAYRDGPVAVAVSRPHRELLERAGFVDIAECDVSEEFAAVTQGWIDQWDLHRPEMEALWGEEAFVVRQRERRASLRTTELGILRRSFFSARRP